MPYFRINSDDWYSFRYVSMTFLLSSRISIDSWWECWSLPPPNSWLMAVPKVRILGERPCRRGPSGERWCPFANSSWLSIWKSSLYHLWLNSSFILFMSVFVLRGCVGVMRFMVWEMELQEIQNHVTFCVVRVLYMVTLPKRNKCKSDRQRSVRSNHLIDCRVRKDFRTATRQVDNKPRSQHHEVCDRNFWS